MRKSQLFLGALIIAMGILVIESMVLVKTRASNSKSAARQAGIEKAGLSERVSVRAAGRGNPYINLSDGHEVITPYQRAEEVVQGLAANEARGLSLSSADFDEDGLPDLITGYAGSGGGIVTLMRGNADSIHPNTPEAKQRRESGEFTDAPFLSPARVFDLPEPPELIASGDFDADNHYDLLTAARGSNRLYLLAGNGEGSFGAAIPMALPGAVTALITGHLGRGGNEIDVAVGIKEARGAKVLVFDGWLGAKKPPAEEFAFNSEVTSLAIGQLDDDYLADLAVAAGRELRVIHGRDRTSAVQGTSAKGAQPIISKIRFDSKLKSFAVGEFGGEHQVGIAAMQENGVIHVIQTEGQAEQHTEQAESGKYKWRKQAIGQQTWAGALEVIRGKVSTNPGDDLLLVDRAGHQVHIFPHLNKGSGDGQGEAESSQTGSVTLDMDDEPLAVLPMRLNGDAFSDLVILKSGAASLSVTMSAPLTTFQVTTSADGSGIGSLRDAISGANASPGADLISFAIPETGVPTITPASGLPSITEPVTIDGTTQSAGLVELKGSLATSTFYGLAILSGSTTVKGMVVNRFPSGVGIGLITNGSNIISGNLIGTDPTGTVDLGNGLDGVIIFQGSSGNTIGGTTSAERNIISGNAREGVYLDGPTTTNNVIVGNYIGTDAVGDADLGNTAAGVFIQNAPSNVVGGLEPNVISGNNGDGIVLFGAGTTLTKVDGNYLGTNASGTQSVANSFCGVTVQHSPANDLGDFAANVISGNANAGVFILGSGASGNIVQRCSIGTNAAGTAAVGNGSGGVIVSGAPGSLIERNRIAGNAGNGISVYSLGSAPPTTISDNKIGIGRSCLPQFPLFCLEVGLGNSGAGLFLFDVSNCQITLNRIAYNGNSGVVIELGAGNKIDASNLLFSNMGLGIDLGNDGIVTQNDTGDGDSGANDLQNFPILSSVNAIQSNSTVHGSLNSTPSNDYTIRFFANSACDPSGNGEGGTSIGSMVVSTDATGNVSFTATGLSGLSPGAVVTATATRDDTNNTSEFSPCQPITCNVSCTAASPGIAAAGSSVPFTSSASPLCGGGAVSYDWNFGDGSPHSTLQDPSHIYSAAGTFQWSVIITISGLGTCTTGSAITIFDSIPRITSFFPTGGFAGTVVTLTGTNFTGATSVKFNGVNAQSFSIDNASQVTAIAPAGVTTGPITVQTPNGTATTSGLFISDFTAGAATITVNSAADTDAADTILTFREAILVANAALGRALTAGEQDQVSGTPTGASLDEIRFLIGSGAQTISVGGTGLGSLPDITGPVVINGTTQTGYAGMPIIELNGAGAGLAASGLHLTSGGSTVRGLVINRFTGDGILMEFIGGNLIANCFIGTGLDGNTGLGNGLNGVNILTSDDNQVGGTTTAARNVISGNTSTGLGLIGRGVSINGFRNVVQGNYIGTAKDGVTALGNGTDGVSFNGNGNTIGGRIVLNGTEGGSATVLGLGNTIAFNNIGVHGFPIDPSQSLSSFSNSILLNAIYANVTEQIRLEVIYTGCYPCIVGGGAGSTNPNSGGTSLSSAVYNGGTGKLEVRGTLTGAPRTAYWVTFYVFGFCPQDTNPNQGTTLQTFLFATNDGGSVAIDRDIPLASPPSGFVNSQSTSLDGSSSPYSNCQELAPQCTLMCSGSAPGTGTTGIPVQFSGSATPSNCAGSPTFDWDFGDLTAHSPAEDPEHTYATAGTYNWSLTVTIPGAAPCTGSSGSITISPPCTLTCSGSAPATATAGIPVQFLGSATPSNCAASPVFDWNFGDGTPNSPAEDPVHTYASAGTFNWSLTVTITGAAPCTESFGSITVSPPCTLTCSGSAPATATAGTPVQFSGSATPSNCAASPVFDWNFGDGTPNSPAEDPLHTYATAGTFNWSLTVTITGAAPCTESFGSITVNPSGTPTPSIGLSAFKTDFDSDGKSEIGFYRSGLWGFLKSGQSYSLGSPQFFSWGGTMLQPICADFDGDAKADLAYLVPPAGGQSAAYAILRSSRNYSFAPGDVLFVPAGNPALGDIPVVGDFDGDLKADPGIWRASQGIWIIPKSSMNYTGYIFSQWGQQGDTPVIADFDMDGKADIGFYRNGLWGVLKSALNYSLGSAQFFSWGDAGLQPIVGDFDGDSKADIGYMVPPSGGQSAVYSILKSSTGYSFLPGNVLFVPAGFPVLGDTPVVGDFDGDGKADPGTWRESQSVWIIPRSMSNYTTYIFSQWGQSGDIPFPNSTGKR